ncbi:MAG: ABC transporter permease [Tannerella sp.]|jgi:ABC-2 type transport system permease protein|nr:ABC transporter permease [Tannerella sp.]
MLKYLLEKEFKQFMRDPFMPRLAILFPIIIMLIMPWTATMDIKDIRVAVVDHDGSTTSDKLIRRIESSPYFYLENVTNNYDDALELVEYGTVDAIVELPQGFEKDFTNTGSVPLQLSINTVNSTRGILGGSYLSAVFEDFSHTFLAERYTEPTVTPSAMPNIQIITQNRFNPYLDYKMYMIPALINILLILLCGFFPAFNIVREKEIGTIEQLNVTPVSRTMFILAKLIPYWLLGMCVLTISMILARFVYGLYPAGSIPIIYLFTFLFILIISGIGLVVSNKSNTMQQALFIMFFFIMIFNLMSGLLTPIRSMPEWAQTLTLFNPVRYYISMMRMMYLKGGGLADLQTELIAHIGFLLFFNLWAVISYRKRG